jgi:hypothetical protein
MVAFGPAVRVAVKVAPIAIEVARQVDRQLRPHVLAYRLARDVDGYVGRWTAQDAAHWLVFPDRSGPPLRAFPPLPPAELEAAHGQLDRVGLRHHSQLPEARARDAVASLRAGPARLRGRRGLDAFGPDGERHLEVTVLETATEPDDDGPPSLPAPPPTPPSGPPPGPPPGRPGSS